MNKGEQNKTEYLNHNYLINTIFSKIKIGNIVYRMRNNKNLSTTRIANFIWNML